MRRIPAAIGLCLVLGVSAAAQAQPPAKPPEATSGLRVRYPDKAFDLMCGSERVQVHFTNPEAHYSEPRGGMLALPRRDGPGPATYTNGRVTITRSGEGDEIAFARGRAALLPCAARRAPPPAAPNQHQH